MYGPGIFKKNVLHLPLISNIFILMKIHKEGYKIIIVSLICLTVMLGMLYKFYPENSYKSIISVVSFAFFLFIVSFFRNPRRNTPEGEDQIICPADGKVVVIEEVYEREYFKDQSIYVSC
jgi:phosphatidylserine decarboxylase